MVSESRHTSLEWYQIRCLTTTICHVGQLTSRVASTPIHGVLTSIHAGLFTNAAIVDRHPMQSNPVRCNVRRRAHSCVHISPDFKSQTLEVIRLSDPMPANRMDTFRRVEKFNSARLTRSELKLLGSWYHKSIRRRTAFGEGATFELTLSYIHK